MTSSVGRAGLWPALFIAGLLLAGFVGCSGTLSAPFAAPPTSSRITGEVDGLWYWELPSTLNGLKPTMSWSGAGSAPNGDVYVAGMDHRTNAALYRLREGSLRYVGDARTASEAAGNWLTDETAAKFHTHPTWLGTHIFVATFPYSRLDDGYLQKRGFHWYRYTPRSGSFIDYRAGDGSGTGLDHGGPASIAVDRTRGVIYGAIQPTGQIVELTLGTRRTRILGRPGYGGRSYVYPGRFMWVDRAGRLYFSAGNSGVPSYGGEYAPSVFNHVYVYDPRTGFGEEATWQLHDQRAIDTGQCFPDAGVCFLADNAGHVYRFTEAGPTWTYLGDIGQKGLSPFHFVWVFHVTPDRSRAYIVATSGDMFEFDLATGVAIHIANLKTVAARLQGRKWLYGFDAWDAQGRFFFSAFTQQPETGPPVLLTAIHPQRLKAALAAPAAP
jgi:hypothetical protein